MLSTLSKLLTEMWCFCCIAQTMSCRVCLMEAFSLLGPRRPSLMWRWRASWERLLHLCWQIWPEMVTIGCSLVFVIYIFCIHFLFFLSFIFSVLVDLETWLQILTVTSWSKMGFFQCYLTFCNFRRMKRYAIHVFITDLTKTDVTSGNLLKEE